MKLVCEHCAEPIETVRQDDNSFTAHSPGGLAVYRDSESLFVCENGCDSAEAVLVESELARRYYRRFGMPDNPNFPVIIKKEYA